MDKLNEIGFADWNKFSLDEMVKHLEKEFQCQSTGTAKAIFTLIKYYNDTKQLHKPVVSGSLPPIEFADELLGDYEMSTFDNGDLCWVLAGTNQKYSTEQIYKILSGNDH